MKLTSRKTLSSAAVVSAFVLTTGFGFGKKAEAPPAYNPGDSAESQASTFVARGKAASYMADVRKIAITSCNVMFAFKSNGSAGTQGGLFSEAGGVTRAEAKVKVEYNLQGMDDSSMQGLTNEICAKAESQTRAAGFDVVPAADLAANEDFQGMHQNARPIPFEYKASGKGTSTRYVVYAPDGQGVFDPRFIGTSAGLGAAMKAAKGESPDLYEGRVMDTLGADAMHLNILVDFTGMQSDGQKAGLGGLASKDSASVDSEARLSIAGDMSIRLKAFQKCWERFGKHECMTDLAKVPGFATANPVISAAPFYTDLVNETTTGDKVANVATKGIAVMAALSGVKGGMSTNVTRYGVHVDPVQYGTEVKTYVAGFIDMILSSAKSAQ